MKILHLADLHLGKSVEGLSMIESQQHVFKQAIKLCKDKNIHHVIISGDVYDRSIPSEEAVSLLNDFLSTCIIDEHIKVYIISGNHDSKERLSCFNDILERQGLYIDTHIKDDLSMNKHVIKEDGLVINIYSLPYIYPGEVREMSNDPSIKSFELSIKKILDANKVNKDEINILNTHYFVTSDKEPLRSDSESKASVGAIEQVSFTLFDDYDYVALGHLHCPQHIGRDTVRYAGSPLRYSVSEIEQDKCFTVINITSKEDVKIEKIDINPLYEFIYLEGSVDELTKDSVTKDYRIIFFKLTDTTHVENASYRLKIKYPHFVGLKYINIKEDFEENSSLNKEEDFEELTIEEQFHRFFKFINDKELDDLQSQIIKEICEELEGEE